MYSTTNHQANSHSRPIKLQKCRLRIVRVYLYIFTTIGLSGALYRCRTRIHRIIIQSIEKAVCVVKRNEGLHLLDAVLMSPRHDMTLPNPVLHICHAAKGSYAEMWWENNCRHICKHNLTPMPADNFAPCIKSFNRCSGLIMFGLLQSNVYIPKLVSTYSIAVTSIWEHGWVRGTHAFEYYHP